MAPKKKYPCRSLSDLYHVIDVVQPSISLTESEDTWDAIDSAIATLTDSCRNGACDYPEELVEAIRPLARNISDAMKSDRTRLSGTAIDLVSVLAESVGTSFDPLVSTFVPTLIVLCGRTNKVVLNRAKACVIGIVENTTLPAILPHFLHYVKDKNTSLRLIAAEGSLACMNCFNPPDLEKEPRAKDIESLIRSTARDANADVRKVSRKLFDAYRILMPDRVQSFTDPLTPTVKKYLDIRPSKTSNPPPLPPLKHQSKSEPAAQPTHTRAKSAPKAILTSTSAKSHQANAMPPPPSTAPVTGSMLPPSRPRSRRAVEDIATQSQPQQRQPLQLSKSTSELAERSYPGRVMQPVRPVSVAEGQRQGHTRSGPRRVLLPEANTKPAKAPGTTSGPGKRPMPTSTSETAGVAIERRKMGAPGRRVLDESELRVREKAPARGEVEVPKLAGSSSSRPEAPKLNSSASSRRGEEGKAVVPSRSREMPPPPPPAHARNDSHEGAKVEGGSKKRGASRVEKKDGPPKSDGHSRKPSESNEEKRAASKPDPTTHKPESKVDRHEARGEATKDSSEVEKAKRRDARRAEKEAAGRRERALPRDAATGKADRKAERKDRPEHREHKDRREEHDMQDRRERRERKKRGDHQRHELSSNPASSKVSGDEANKEPPQTKHADAEPAVDREEPKHPTENPPAQAVETPLPPSPQHTTAGLPELEIISQPEVDQELELAKQVPLPPSPDIDPDEVAFEEQAFIVDEPDENAQDQALDPPVLLPLPTTRDNELEQGEEDEEADVLAALPVPKTPARKVGAKRLNPFQTPLSRLMYAVEHGFDQDASLLMMDESPEKQQPARMPQMLKEWKEEKSTNREGRLALDELALNS